MVTPRVNHHLPRASTTIYPLGSTLVDMGTVGDRLRRLREAEGLSLEQAGAIGNTTKQSMSQIEKGITKMPGGLPLYLWAKHYRVGLEWLITGKETKLAASQSGRPTGRMIVSAYREALRKYAATGLAPTSFDPFNDLDHAELLASALAAQQEAPADSSIQVPAEVGRGSNRARSGVIGKDRAAKAGGEGRPAPSQRKKRTA